MPLRRKWTEADIGAAIRVLGKHTDLDAAVFAIEHELKRRVTRAILRKAFRRASLGDPAEFLAAEPDVYETKWSGYANLVCRPPNSNTSLVIRAAPEPEPERLLILGDCHHPYVDVDAWNLMLRFAQSWRPDRIIVLGDFVDCVSVSAHSRDPNRIALIDDEIDVANAALDQLDQLGASEKHFIEGNHCYRLQRYLADRAPALYNQISIRGLLGLEERGWSFTPYREHLKIGHVHYVHDTGSAGASAHTKAGAAFESSVVIGHVHRLACSYFGNALGDTHVAVAAGWLGSAKAADYMHKIKATREWMHGFVTGLLEPDGTTHLQLHPIVNGRVRDGGRVVV